MYLSRFLPLEAPKMAYSKKENLIPPGLYFPLIAMDLPHLQGGGGGGLVTSLSTRGLLLDRIYT